MTSEGYHLGPSPSWYLTRITDCNNDGIFAYGAQNNLILLDISKTPPIYKITKSIHKDKLTCLTFSTKNPWYLATGGKDAVVQIWDIREFDNSLHQIACHRAIVCLEWQSDNDNTIFLIDETGSVLSWNIHHTSPKLIRHGIRTHASALASWPFNARYLAVGFKNGLIAVLNIAKGGETTYVLKGHDDEILSLSWNIKSLEDDNRKSWSEAQDLLSTSKDRTLRTWNLEREKCMQITKPPQTNKNISTLDKKNKQPWMVAQWRPECKFQALCSNYSDLLIAVVRANKRPHWEIFDTKEIGGHQRTIFNISTFKSNIAITVSQDRQIIVWDIQRMKSVFVLPTLGGFAYCLSFSPLDIGRLAIGVGDNTVKLWNTLSSVSPYTCQTFWQGIKGKVTALSWHPENESWLGFGTEEGRVGILDVLSNKLPIVSSTHHRNQVYGLSWGPIFGEKETVLALYSCGDEMVRIHDLRKPESEALNFELLIGDGTSNHVGTEERVKGANGYTEVRWNPDWTVLGLGHKDGLVEIYSGNGSWALLARLNGQRHLVQSLCWHPICTTLSPSSSPFKSWLAVSTYDTKINLYDLSDVLQTSHEKTREVMNATCVLGGHGSRVTTVTWSPHLDGRLASASFDGTAQVWDAASGQPLGNYRGHLGNAFSVAWSPHDPDTLFSGSDDCSVHQFSVSKLIDKTPPTKRIKAAKVKKVKEEALRKDSDKSNWRETTPTPMLNEAALPQQSLDETNGAPKQTLPKTGQVEMRKKRVHRSLFPVSNLLENRNKTSTLQDIQLLTDRCKTEDIASKEEADVHLAFFSNQQEIVSMVNQEGKYHLEHGNMDCAFQLDVWRGDIVDKLREAAQKQALNDFLISVANLASRAIWLEMCEKYSEQLASEGNYTKAATYLLTCHKVYEAIDLLKDQNMFKEAITIAKLRLPSTDPTIEELTSLWALKAEKDGNFELVAKCFLSSGDYAGAAKILSKRSDSGTQRIAAYVAASHGLHEETYNYVAQCLRLALVQKEYNLVKQLVSEQQGINVLEDAELLLWFSAVHELLSEAIVSVSQAHYPGILSNFFVEMKSSNVLLWMGSSPAFLSQAREQTVAKTDSFKILLTKLFPQRMTCCNQREILLQTALDLTFSGLEETDSEASWEPLLQALLQNYQSDFRQSYFKELTHLLFHSPVFWRSPSNVAIDISVWDTNGQKPLFSLNPTENSEMTTQQQSFVAFFFANLLNILLEEVQTLPRSRILIECAEKAQLKQIEKEILAEISVAEKNEKSPNKREDPEILEVEKGLEEASNEALERAKEQCLQLLKEKLMSMGMQCTDVRTQKESLKPEPGIITDLELLHNVSAEETQAAESAIQTVSIDESLDNLVETVDQKSEGGTVLEISGLDDGMAHRDGENLVKGEPQSIVHNAKIDTKNKANTAPNQSIADYASPETISENTSLTESHSESYSYNDVVYEVPTEVPGVMKPDIVLQTADTKTSVLVEHLKSPITKESVALRFLRSPARSSTEDTEALSPPNKLMPEGEETVLTGEISNEFDTLISPESLLINQTAQESDDSCVILMPVNFSKQQTKKDTTQNLLDGSTSEEKLQTDEVNGQNLLFESTSDEAQPTKNDTDQNLLGDDVQEADALFEAVNKSRALFDVMMEENLTAEVETMTYDESVNLLKNVILPLDLDPSHTAEKNENAAAICDESIEDLNNTIPLEVLDAESCSSCREVIESFRAFMLTMCRGFAVGCFVKRQKFTDELRLLEIKIASIAVSVDKYESDNEEVEKRVKEMQVNRSLLTQQLQEYIEVTNNVPFPNVCLLSEKLLQLSCLLLPKITCTWAKEQVKLLSQEMQKLFE